MEQDPNLTARLESFVNEAEEFIKEKSKPKVHTEGNIIRLDFNKDKK